MKVCSVDGCDEKHHAKGRCIKHYHRRPKHIQQKKEYNQRQEVKKKVKIRSTLYRQEPINKERARELHKIYYKNNKEKVKQKHDEWLAKNKEKVKQKHKIWAEKNKEHIKEYHQKTREQRRAYNHKRKAKIKNVIHNFSTLTWVFKKYHTNGFCPRCDRYIGIYKLAMDHTPPISKVPEGFIYDINDVTPMCKSCNSSKGTKV